MAYIRLSSLFVFLISIYLVFKLISLSDYCQQNQKLIVTLIGSALGYWLYRSQKSQREYYAIGMMSGTSLDGMDLAYCRFVNHKFEILAAETIPYPQEIKQRLVQCKDDKAY